MDEQHADEQNPPQGAIARTLDAVPRVLASKTHIAWLFVLFVWIVLLAAVAPDLVSARTELILGNYTNVTSAIGACIAAGGTVTAVHHLRRQSRISEQRLKLEEERHAMATQTHQLLRELHASQLGGTTGAQDA
ncbi:MAG TPA: hypothetical protein VIB48_01975 [Acidimicrobiia bacterium]